MKYRNLILLGTSHIAAQSVKEVERIVEKEQPGIIAVELDKKRVHALTHPQKKKIRVKDVLRIGIKGFLFSLLGAYVEKKLGEIVNVAPGAEMKRAIQIAKKQKIKIALIDQDIEITLKKLSKSLSWKEKWRFVVDLFKAFVLRKKEVDFDLTKVPDEKLIHTLITKVKRRYPNIYAVLIAERNVIMAGKLGRLMLGHPETTILAIMGAGHQKEVKRLVQKYLTQFENHNNYKVTYSIGK